MAFVHVEGGGRTAQTAQQADTADAEEHFLHDACRAVPAVNTVGQIAIKLFILGQVGVQQIDWHATDIDPPDLEINGSHANFHAANEAFPLASFKASNGTLSGSTGL